MVNSPKDRIDNLKKSLTYVAKLLSTAIIVVLLLVGAFLIYYVISNKIIATKTGVPPKISLYTIVSGSMEPAIKVSDIILNVKIDDFSTLNVGDVITYKSHSTLIPDIPITHRIIDIRINESTNKREFITKGDYNEAADSSPVQEADVLGKTILKIPMLGKIQFLLSSKIGWFFVVLLPALGIIVYDILKLFKVIGVTGQAEQVKGNVDNIRTKEENKKILETLEKINKNPIKNFKKNPKKINDQRVDDTKEKELNDNQHKLSEQNKFFINLDEETKIEETKIEETIIKENQPVKSLDELKSLITIKNAGVVSNNIENKKEYKEEKKDKPIQNFDNKMKK